MVLKDLHLHFLCEYVYGLIQYFSTSFYNHCKVIGDPNERSRILLIELCRRILKQGFHLLGFKALEQI